MIAENQHRRRVAAVVIVLAASCLALFALQTSDESSSEKYALTYLGASEEDAARKAIKTAQSVDRALHTDDALVVSGVNPAPDDNTLKEVEKAEEEQAAENNAETYFASGGEADDIDLDKMARSSSDQPK